jgi:predicted dehydrogenase
MLLEPSRLDVIEAAKCEDELSRILIERGGFMAEPVRVGIVGARFAARFHLEGLNRVYGVPVQVVGITSKTAEARDALAKEKNIQAFETIAELCEAVDVIDLCTPPSSHEALAVEALSLGKHVIIEKPFTGYFGAGAADFRGNTYPKKKMLDEAMKSCERILAAANGSGRKVCYAENWIYAPSIQKEREIVMKSDAQILWMRGEQSHSGSHSPYYGRWEFSGGGSLVGKGCHPLSAALHLKRVEGESRNGAPIRPATVSARTHEITRLKCYRDEGFLRTAYNDIEDYAQVHVKFSDGTVADIFASELVLGGVQNSLEVICNNHRTRCALNPIDALETFNPQEDLLKDVYLVEKIGTKQGWSHPAPDESWQHGYPQEFQDFMESIWHNREPLSGIALARDTTAVLYASYVSTELGGVETAIPDL